MSDTYDFIVVGAGPAGAILAKRLATFSSAPRVALIETGSKHEGLALRHTYDRFLLAYTKPQLDHGYVSAPQPGLGNREIGQARGKGLGGSTQTNFQIWSLGGRDEFDAWANAVQDPAWGFDSILENVKRFEKLTVDLPDEWSKYVRPTPDAHGFSGEVDVSIGGQIEPEARHMIDAGIEAGYSLNTDQNDGDPIGIGLCAATNRRGIRTTSASAFLDQHGLPNLTIITDSQVAKIMFDGPRAIGIETVTGQKVLAGMEVILSAGAIDTPKLLLLSGVGPRSHLDSLGIEVNADLPVGKNLVDHPCVPITYRMAPGFSSRLEFRKDAEGLEKALQELESGGGPLTQLFSTAPTAFLKKDELYTSDEFAQLPRHSQVLLTQPTVPSFEFAIAGPLLPPDYHFADPDDSYFNFFVTLMGSQSRGEVTLAGIDPLTSPVIDPHYLENPYDQLVLKTAIRESLKWMEAPSLKKFVKGAILAPKSEADVDIENFIKAAGMGLYHPACSVRMGRRGDPTTCVDHNLRVLGLDGLRVADLSVPPELPSGHPQIVAYAIGQIASEKIKAHWNL